MSPDDPRHGEYRGAIAHAMDGERPCQPCRTAAATYRRNLRARRYLTRQDRLYIDSTGTIRRIRALMALGWRLADLDQALGHRADVNYCHNITRQAKVHYKTARKVAGLYDRLSMKLGPSERTRTIAQKRGWLPPLAWDDDHIDDPTYRPRRGSNRRRTTDIDPAVVQRFLAGEYDLRLTRAEKFEVVRRWQGSQYELEKVSGFKPERYIERRDGAVA